MSSDTWEYKYFKVYSDDRVEIVLNFTDEYEQVAALLLPEKKKRSKKAS